MYEPYYDNAFKFKANIIDLRYKGRLFDFKNAEIKVIVEELHTEIEEVSKAQEKDLEINPPKKKIFNSWTTEVKLKEINNLGGRQYSFRNKKTIIWQQNCWGKEKPTRWI